MRWFASCPAPFDCGVFCILHLATRPRVVMLIRAKVVRSPRPPIYVRHGGLWYQLIAKATYLRRLRYQLIAKATYLVRRGGLRYQLVATATYLRLRLRFSSFSL